MSFIYLFAVSGMEKYLHVLFVENSQIKLLSAFEWGDDGNNLPNYVLLPENPNIPKEKVGNSKALIYAFYGSQDITEIFKEKFDKGERVFEASNSVWGDPNPSKKKSQKLL